MPVLLLFFAHWEPSLACFHRWVPYCECGHLFWLVSRNCGIVEWIIQLEVEGRVAASVACGWTGVTLGECRQSYRHRPSLANVVTPVFPPLAIPRFPASTKFNVQHCPGSQLLRPRLGISLLGPGPMNMRMCSIPLRGTYSGKFLP